MKNVTLVCDPKEIINMFMVSKVSGLVENFNTEIFSDTINVTNVKRCMIVLLIELYVLIPFSVTLTVFQCHGSVKQFQLKTLYFYLIKSKLCRILKHVTYIMNIPLFLTFAIIQGR